MHIKEVYSLVLQEFESTFWQTKLHIQQPHPIHGHTTLEGQRGAEIRPDLESRMNLEGTQGHTSSHRKEGTAYPYRHIAYILILTEWGEIYHHKLLRDDVVHEKVVGSSGREDKNFQVWIIIIPRNKFPFDVECSSSSKTRAG